MSRVFHQRVALLTSNGQHIRYVPAAMAHAMVSGGAAQPDQSAGRVRGVVLTHSAASYARCIGPPTDGGFGVRFYRWQRLDESACRIIQHHPRSTDYGDED